MLLNWKYAAHDGYAFNLRIGMLLLLKHHQADYHRNTFHINYQ